MLAIFDPPRHDTQQTIEKALDLGGTMKALRLVSNTLLCLCVLHVMKT